MAEGNRYEELDRRRAELQAGGGQERVDKQHSQGKLSARERLALLFDQDSFVEFGLWVKNRNADLGGKEFPGDGVVTGKGEVLGRPVLAFSQDFTVGGGAVGKMHAEKIVECMWAALKCGSPVARRTRRRSPTSSSWWIGRRTCSSPAPR
jgi:acetyl-CoA carboxylase carboxyltransferase component